MNLGDNRSISATIQTALVCGGIERNPGPPPRGPRADRRLTRQATLSFSTDPRGPHDDRLTALEDRLAKLEAENRHLRNKVESLENQSRRNNLVFYGLEESDTETWDQCESKVTDFIKDELNIEIDTAIDRAHRLGKKRTRSRDAAAGPRGEAEDASPQTSRPVIVRFNRWKEKEKVLSAARSYYKDQRETQDNVVGGVGEDFSQEVREQRRKLLPFLKSQREMNPNLPVHLRFNKLLVGKKLFVLNNSENGITPLNAS